MAVEHVDRIGRLAAHLGVKLKPPRPRPPFCTMRRYGHEQIEQVVVELVGVPAVLRVAAIDVDRAQDAERDGASPIFVFEAVAGEGGVVGFDVDLHVLLETEAAPASSKRWRCRNRIDAWSAHAASGSIRIGPFKLQFLCL